MSQPLSILLVDDHVMVRQMLENRLANEPDLQVVGAVGSAEDAVTEAIKQRPDIILMDIDMPGMICFEATTTIQSRCPEVRVIFLSAFFNDRYIEEALDVRAWGYITKSESQDTVVEAIRKVASGVAYFSPEVQERIIFDTAGVRLAHQGRSRVSTLTEREMQVLRYLARGMSKKQVAQTMHISANTVNRHTTSLMDKLDIHDRVELARFAIREGLAEA